MKVPGLEEWRKLYDLATKFKTLAPWKWMSEIDLFGVQSPETGETVFVSISGMDGGVPGLRCFRGSEGLYGFLDFIENIHDATLADIMQIQHIQLGFTQRRNLADFEHKNIQTLKLKFPRRGLYPAFRTYVPGQFPWGINQDEARLMMYVLEQTIEVANRYKTNDDLFLPDEDDEGDMFVRVPVNENGDIKWQDQFVEINPPDTLFVPPSIDERSLLVLHQLPRRPQAIEIDAMMTPVPTVPEDDPDGRPFFPFLLLAADAKVGTIYLNEMMRPIPSMDAMWRTIPQLLINMFATIGFVPSELRTTSSEVCEMLKTISYRLKITVRQTDLMPVFHAAVTEFMNTMTRDYMSDNEFFDEDEEESEEQE